MPLHYSGARIDSIPKMIKQIVALVQSDVVSNKYHAKPEHSATVCHTTKSLVVANDLIEQNKVDLLIVELTKHVPQYQDFISYVREVSYPTKILVIASLESNPPQERYLASGADLFLKEPVTKKCLDLYCDKLLNFDKHKLGALLHLANVALQLETAHLYIGSAQYQLRKREAEILAYFFRRKNQVITRTMLIDGIWGFSDDVPEFTTVDVYIRRLRMRLKNSGAILQTIRGIGYIAKEL
ncbi:MAG: hypothetical protein COU67_00665 [Candidatus Pacebacteria bacterium CG10_big_fil_rev_8_21_14_0_10_44_54]|nr:MAG: hypothetical protein COU67_00665 [Candidatus Pacebacteria bacterium CG10_big_fil_rev_8_21_14_0_10_44_54]